MLSVTDLASYLFCPRKLYLTKVLRLEEPPKEALVLGTIRHSLYEGANAQDGQLVKTITPMMDLPEINEHYTAAYSKILRTTIAENKNSLKKLQLDMQEVFVRQWKYVQKEARARAAFVSSFIKEHAVYGEELWLQLTPKILSEVRVESAQLKLKGIVDQIEVHQSHIVPVELKTGSMAPQGLWPGHRIQLSAYMVLLQERWDKPVTQGKIRYLDHDAEKILPFNPFYGREIEIMAETVQELLDEKVPPPHIENKNKCNSCSLRERCYDPEFIAERVKTLPV